jgi:hypothetical protein
MPQNLVAASPLFTLGRDLSPLNRHRYRYRACTPDSR